MVRKSTSLSAQSPSLHSRRSGAAADTAAPPVLEASTAAGAAFQVPRPSEEAMRARKKCSTEIGKGKFEYSQALAEVISHGACFHHGDLIPRDRKLVEELRSPGGSKIPNFSEPVAAAE